jgi:hypothetical protein
MIWVNGDAKDVIREEAIKWIKEIRHKRANTLQLIDKIQFEFEVNNSPDQDWIKHFFNITEEDLK